MEEESAWLPAILWLMPEVKWLACRLCWLMLFSPFELLFVWDPRLPTGSFSFLRRAFLALGLFCWAWAVLGAIRPPWLRSIMSDAGLAGRSWLAELQLLTFTRLPPTPTLPPYLVPYYFWWTWRWPGRVAGCGGISPDMLSFLLAAPPDVDCMFRLAC